jgi:hypothetical protein
MVGDGSMMSALNDFLTRGTFFETGACLLGYAYTYVWVRAVSSNESIAMHDSTILFVVGTLAMLVPFSPVRSTLWPLSTYWNPS